ncbi:hypothetical protein VTP01DRAFT_7537 [Rhizomucor pusillus]|uniref:uncharacterized protein n=1 Tax=Rhizomucor pusillus TaxID=4840 RepID=UPI00374396A6
MHRRQTRQTASNSNNTGEPHSFVTDRSSPPPLQQVLSSLPQLALSLAIIIFINKCYGRPFDERYTSGLWFYVTCLSFFSLCGVFLYLQAKRASYKNWQENPSTRTSIQIASLAGSVSFIGFHVCCWSLYGWATPVFTSASFVLVFSILHILSALLF